MLERCLGKKVCPHFSGMFLLAQRQELLTSDTQWVCILREHAEQNSVRPAQSSELAVNWGSA